MDIDRIKAIRKFYDSGATHQQVMDKFGINNAQSLAINIIGRLSVSDDVLLSKMDELTPVMEPGEIREVLGLN